MYTVENIAPLIKTSMEHHVTAAEYHENAADAHRQAAAYYRYGYYQQANEHARLAKSYGQHAEEHCARALE